MNVYLDGEFQISISAEVAMGSHLRVGRELSPDDLRALESDDLAWRAREAALRLLSYRPRTESELRRRLRTKDFPSEIIERCTRTLVASGLVDDGGFARSYVRDRLRARPSGRARLLAELRRKGVTEAEAESAVDEALAEISETELDLARRATGKFARRRAEDPARRRRRLYGFLSRRGFPSDVITRVIEETDG
ncbi:MAG: regulatory protein RecX [Gemmatimonadota bacterium]